MLLTTTCYLLLTTYYQDLVHSLVRDEWWWPWGELPRSLKLAALDLGYDRYRWQAEVFKHSGQRFLDWEEVEIERGGIVVDDDAGSACSDSELTSGHNGGSDKDKDLTPDAREQWRLGGCKDTMDLLAEPGRRSSCQGAYAAYRPRGGYSFEMYGIPGWSCDWSCTLRPDWSYSLRAL